MTHDDKTMLALAALTYRGFGLPEEALAGAVRPWLPKLETEGLGRWKLVWGPASFRAATSVVDDAMMYVVQQTDRPSGAPPRYVVAVRGTNPVSPFDWIFGDFWVRLGVDWKKGGEPGKVSASTALGLAISQNLTAELPSSNGGVLSSLRDKIMRSVDELSGHLPRLDLQRLVREPQVLSDKELLAHIQGVVAAAGGSIRTRMLRLLSRDFAVGGATLEGVIEQHVFDSLLHHIETERGPGRTLLQFLNTPGIERNATIAVTGHSKGGALAVAIALWLAETWAPQHSATIECFSFAGPTAGDAAFAARYNARLGQRTRRITNARDVVPQAWVADDLRRVRDIHPILAPALNGLIPSIERLGYVHVGGEKIEITSRKHAPELASELIHQHLDAYLADARFNTPGWKATELLLAV